MKHDSFNTSCPSCRAVFSTSRLPQKQRRSDIRVRFGQSFCNGLRCLLLAIAAVFADVAEAQLDSSSSLGPSTTHTPASEVSRRNTAVTLNYCRAALHRIRRAPSKKVLLEEQQRILNNLDLNQIDDPEVITLYRSILDEIGQVEISDRERVVIGEQFQRGIQRKLGTDFFVIGAQAATGQVGNVIQSGANSWWDYRSTQIKRDADMWQVEKTQFTTLMSRLSTFLDIFWKLSRKNEIPDKWLLRDQDLDQLTDTLEEQEPERRLRMLARAERFMEGGLLRSLGGARLGARVRRVIRRGTGWT